ncbi:MAG: HAD-IA family hydrolase [Anaerolineales bacterium]|nr:HAD-IA family hydrolase [Chloroflexota bacterium]MBL6981439.1 HAD-IA family hydrolase [Anaerolineales bacterium]
MIRGIIFDFDGLILDTESTIYQSWLELYQEYNLDLPFEEWGQIIGISPDEHFDPLERLQSQLDSAIDGKEVGAKRLQREIDLVEKQPILPGVEEILFEARKMNLKLAIASSSDREWVGGHLERLDLMKHFDIVHTSDDVERTKPDPALYQLALKSLGLDADEVFVLEDSPNGITAAQSAGIFCVVVPNPLTRLLSVDHADLQLTSLADVALGVLVNKIESLKN